MRFSQLVFADLSTDTTLGLAVISVFSSLVGALVAFIGMSFTRSDEIRKIKAQAITAERQRWRDDIRLLVPKLISEDSSLKVSELAVAIELRVNPYKDQSVLMALELLLLKPSEENKKVFVREISVMLKNDWERSKEEISKNKNADKRAKVIIDSQLKMANQ